MSAISREEIEREARMKFSTYYALQRAGLKDDYFIPGVVEFAERVAALVEERMKEMVCEQCGETWADEMKHDCLTQAATIGYGACTRAQYQAKKKKR